MAKKSKSKSNVLIVRLVNPETGTFFVKKKPIKGNNAAFSKKRGAVAQNEKMSFRKYDPKLRKHATFVEKKNK